MFPFTRETSFFIRDAGSIFSVCLFVGVMVICLDARSILLYLLVGVIILFFFGVAAGFNSFKLMLDLLLDRLYSSCSGKVKVPPFLLENRFLVDFFDFSF